MDDVRKIVTQRETLKTENQQLRDRIQQLEGKGSGGGGEGRQQQGQQQQQQGGEPKTVDQIVEAKLAERDNERARLDRRKAITDVILNNAHPQHKDALRLMLPSLHEAKELNLDAEDTTSESDKALDKLRKKFPGYFRPQGPGAGGTQDGASADLEGVEWMQLTPEEQRSMSPEDFRKRFASGQRRRGSNLVGRTPNRT
jgi:hypothetical protein